MERERGREKLEKRKGQVAERGEGGKDKNVQLHIT